MGGVFYPVPSAGDGDRETPKVLHFRASIHVTDQTEIIIPSH